MIINMQNHSSNYNEELNLKIKLLARGTKESPFIVGWLVFYVITLFSVLGLLLFVYPRMQDYSKNLETAGFLNVPIIEPKLPHVVEVPSQQIKNSDNVIYKQLEPNNNQALNLGTRAKVEEPISTSKPFLKPNNTLSIVGEIVNQATNQDDNSLPLVQKVTLNDDSQAYLPKTLPKGNWVIQLGSFRSQEKAENAWATILKKHNKTSKYLIAFYTNSIIGESVFIRLQSGYFDTQENARKWCVWFVKNDQTCLSVPISNSQ